eukprot:755738-Hanusia_phi.AAC.9
MPERRDGGEARGYRLVPSRRELREGECGDEGCRRTYQGVQLGDGGRGWSTRKEEGGEKRCGGKRWEEIKGWRGRECEGNKQQRRSRGRQKASERQNSKVTITKEQSRACGGA